jgi:hypothetical protein
MRTLNRRFTFYFWGDHEANVVHSGDVESEAEEHKVCATLFFAIP